MPTTEELLAQLIELQKQQSKGTGGLGASITSKDSERLGRYSDDMEKLTKQVDAQIKSLKKANSVTSTFTKMLSEAPAQLSALAEDLEELDDRIKNEIDQEKKNDLIKKRNQLWENAAKGDAITATVKLGKAMWNVAQTGLQGSMAFVKGLQNGASGIELASGLMATQIEMEAQTTVALGQAAGTAGQALMTLPSMYAKGIGAALAILGPVMGMAAEQTAKLAKFGIEVLAKEVEKTIKAYNDSTAAGALFARGMEDLRKYSGAAGLTVDQFANVLKNNSAALAESGYTVSGAAKIVSGVTSNLATQTSKNGNSLQRELMNLGIGFEEQAALVAQQTANLKRSGGTATNAQMAQATLEMGKNMKIVADIMGADAKSREEEAKKRATAYAFDKKLRDLAKQNNDPGLIDRAHKAMAMLSADQQEAAMQATVMNGIVTNLNANLYGQVGAAQDFATALATPGSSIQSLNDGFARATQDFDKNNGQLATSISAAAIMGVDSLNNFAKGANELGQAQFQLTQQNLKTATDAVEATAKINSGFHSAIMDVEKTAQDLRIALQEKLTPQILGFAKAAEAILASMDTIIGGLNNTKGPLDFLKGIGEDVEDVGIGITALGGVLAAVGALLSFTGVGAAVGVPLAAAGTSMMTGGVATIAAGSASTMLGFADGGISTTTNPKGVLAMVSEGGINEAHVPLPDGKSIPVNITGLSTAAAELNKATAALREVTEKLSMPNAKDTAKETRTIADNMVNNVFDDFLNQFKDMHIAQMGKQDELIEHMRDTKDFSQRILQASQ